MRITSAHFRKPVLDADPTNPGGRLAAGNFRHGRSQAAKDGVLFQDDNTAMRAANLGHGLFVERLQARHAPDAGFGPLRVVRHGNRCLDHRTSGQQGHVVPRPNEQRTATIEPRDFGMAVAQVCFSHPQVHAAPSVASVLRKQLWYFPAVGRREDRQVRQCPQGRHVFGALMTGSQRAIHNSGPVADKHDRQALVTDVELDLLVNADRDEGRQPIDDRPQAGLRQSGRHADHVLLGDTRIDELPWAGAAQVVEQRVAVVARQQQEAFIALGGGNQFGRKNATHVPALP